MRRLANVATKEVEMKGCIGPIPITYEARKKHDELGLVRI